MTVGERIRAERQRLGLTQAAMASACGVQPNSQILYEKNVRVPRAGYLREAVKLGVDCSYLITGKRTPRSDVSISGDESRLLQSVMTLRPDDREALIRVLQRICPATRQCQYQ